MDYNTYLKQKNARQAMKTEKNTVDATQNNGYANAQTDNLAKEAIGNAINAYSKMTKDQMMQALYSEVNREKRSGVFNINNIYSFYRSIAPMLSKEDSERMKFIIDSIESNLS